MAGNDTKSTLLCHWNGPDGAKEIIDDGNTGHIVSLVGSAQTSTVAKTIGNCSLVLNGSTDYITISGGADLNFGTNVTIEMWINFTALPASAHYFPLMSRYDDGSNFYYLIIQNSGGVYKIQIDTYSGGVQVGSAIADLSPQPTTGTWYHLAFVKANTTTYFFQNGASLSVTQSDPWDAQPSLTADAYVGKLSWYTDYGNGYIDELRCSNIARYTAAFTPSTIAFTSDTASTVLLHMESHDTAIGGSYLPATFVGTAQLDTAVKTFGTASLLLDGDSDYVSFPNSALWAVGTGDFMVDCRVYWNDLTGYQRIWGQWETGNTAWYLSKDSNGKLSLIIVDNEAGTNYTYYITNFAPSLSTAVWYHIAVGRSGTTYYTFLDGTALAATLTTTSHEISNTGPFTIGGNASEGNYYLNGYIDEFRMSRTCRWTSNFTPPSAEYSEDAPTPPASTRRIFLIT